MQEGKPLTFASHALTTAEHNYAQIEKVSKDSFLLLDASINTPMEGLPVDLDEKSLEMIFASPSFLHQYTFKRC